MRKGVKYGFTPFNISNADFYYEIIIIKIFKNLLLIIVYNN
jgi:hypothetical protein